MRIKSPVLTQGEEVLLFSQGGICLHLRAGWKLGRVYLTSKRLLFLGPARVIFETPLHNIKDIKIEKKRYVLGDKNALCISYNPVLHSTTDGSRVPEFSKIWLLINDLETFERKICEKSGLQPIFSSLPEEDEGLKKEELDKEEVERTAKREVGKRTLLDVFDERDYLTIVAEILNAKEKDILMKVEGTKFKLSATTPDNKYEEEILLPSEVKGIFSKKYHNNILEIKLIKK